MSSKFIYAVSRKEKYLIPLASRVSSGNECRWSENMQQCDEFRKSNGNETYMCQPITFCCFKDITIFDPGLASFMSMRLPHIFKVLSGPSQTKIKRRPCPKLFWGLILFNGEDIIVRV